MALALTNIFYIPCVTIFFFLLLLLLLFLYSTYEMIVIILFEKRRGKKYTPYVYSQQTSTHKHFYIRCSINGKNETYKTEWKNYLSLLFDSYWIHATAATKLRRAVRWVALCFVCWMNYEINTQALCINSMNFKNNFFDINIIF